MKESQKLYSSNVLDHLKKYWILSKRFFEENDYALALFFSVTLIEEVGKIIYININKFLNIKNINKKIIRSHKKKYIQAVRSTLVVNSRVSRIYKEKESKFAEWFRKGKIFEFRNKALYMELVDSKIQIPNKIISKEDSFLFVCISGEIFAEIQGNIIGTDAEAWKAILEEVDDFRKKFELLR